MATLDVMYPGIPYSPPTTLLADISATDTTVTVADGAALPDAPNKATIGSRDNAETVFYGTKSGGILGDVQRGVEDGGAGKAWGAGMPVGNYFTAGEYSALINNINALNAAKTEAVDVRTIAGGLIWNPNLLTNWDFTIPVNQRGQASYTGVGYTIDRWRKDEADSVVSIVDGGVSIQNNTSNVVNFYQPLFDYGAALNEKTITLSAEVNNTIYTASGQQPIANGWFLSVDFPGGQVGLWSVNAQYQLFMFRVNANSSVLINRAKLEWGSISTMHNDPPMDYGTELAKCQPKYPPKFPIGDKAYMLQASKAVYVSLSGSDTAGDGTQASPWQTIEKAINDCPKNLNTNEYVIMLADGDYRVQYADFNYPRLNGFYGFGKIELRGNLTTPDNCKLPSLGVFGCMCKVLINGIQFSKNTGVNELLVIEGASNNVFVDKCSFDATNAGVYCAGVSASSGYLRLSNCVFNDCSYCVGTESGYSNVENFSTLLISDCPGGANNDIGLAVNGGIIQKINENMPSANTAFTKSNGGIIVNANGTFA